MDRDEIRAAVEMLVTTDRYAVLKKELRELIATREELPRRFAADLAPLNALIALEKNNPEAFENVLNLIEAKRSVEPSTGKTDYQRDYMRQRRARLNTALKIEETERGKSLSPAARAQFKEAQLKQWMGARDAYIHAKGDLDWKARNDATAEFWKTIDAQLELRLVEARGKYIRK